MVTEQQENFFLTLTEQLIVQTDKEKVAWQEKLWGCGKMTVGEYWGKPETVNCLLGAWNRFKTYYKRENEGRKKGQRSKEKWWQKITSNDCRKSKNSLWCEWTPSGSLTKCWKTQIIRCIHTSHLLNTHFLCILLSLFVPSVWPVPGVPIGCSRIPQRALTMISKSTFQTNLMWENMRWVSHNDHLWLVDGWGRPQMKENTLLLLSSLLLFEAT